MKSLVTLMGLVIMLLMALPLSLDATVLRIHPAESWSSLARDTEKEAFVEVIFRLAGKTMKVPVVIDPAADRWCAYATIRGGQPYIGISSSCVGSLRKNGGYNWDAIAVICHEVGHILGGHIYSIGNHHSAETEADEFSGWAMHRVGSTLEQALAHASTYQVEQTDTHPGRRVRFESYARGWMRAKAGEQQFERLSVQRRSWWADLMQRRLPWVR